MCLPQSRAVDGVVPETSLIGKSYIQRSSLQRLVLFLFFPFNGVRVIRDTAGLFYYSAVPLFGYLCYTM